MVVSQNYLLLTLINSFNGHSVSIKIGGCGRVFLMHLGVFEQIEVYLYFSNDGAKLLLVEQSNEAFVKIPQLDTKYFHNM
jgi:hypothetical protein